MADNGRVVVITGGNSGIGQGIALHFRDAGYLVAIIGRRTGRLRETVEAVGAGCTAFHADVSRREDVVRAVHEVLDEYGRLDVLIK